MINRAPLPEAHFLIIRNAVARDANLSYRASGVLADILSRPDNWVVSAERLAKSRPRHEGVKAIRSALIELEEAGYLKRERTRGEDGKFGWVQNFWDTPQDWAAVPVADVSAGHTVSPFSPGGSVQGGNRPSKEVPTQRTTKEDDPVQACTTSSRFAPSGGGDAERSKIDDPWYDPWAPAVHPAETERTNGETQFENWRAEDRSLFKELIGEKVRSDGTKWNTGTWSADDFYTAYRKRNGKRLAWPGRYLNRLNEDGYDRGIDDWMISEGLEKAE